MFVFKTKQNAVISISLFFCRPPPVSPESSLSPVGLPALPLLNRHPVAAVMDPPALQLTPQAQHPSIPLTLSVLTIIIPDPPPYSHQAHYHPQSSKEVHMLQSELDLTSSTIVTAIQLKTRSIILCLIMTRAHEAQLAPLIEALLQTQRLLLWNHQLQPIPICSDLMTAARCVQGRLDSTEAILHCLPIIQCPARFPEILAVPGNKVKFSFSGHLNLIIMKFILLYYLCSNFNTFY